MTTALRRLVATTLTALALAAPLGTSASVAAAPTPAPGNGRSQEFVSVAIDSVTPSSVTTSSPPTVTVTGTVHNVGDRTVHDVQARLQRAPAVTTGERVRSVLLADQSQFDFVGEFVPVRDRLDVGQSAQFTLALPVRSADQPSLGVDEPGVYPLLVNVNGTPDYGGPARLDDARFLLPVLGLPRDPDGVGSGAAPMPPSTVDPVAVTMLWPLADRPRIAAGLPGSTDAPTRLVDDDLATSLAPGGRLAELVAAVEFATADELDRDRQLTQSLCLAVDPDLLVTVAAMTRGYLVVDHPDDPTGRARTGTGQIAATDWLDRLRRVAARMCVTAVPFAQVDLTALARVGDPTLAARALQDPADIVDGLLGVTSLRGVTWPDSGVLDPAAAATLPGLGPTALLAANAVSDARTRSNVALDVGRPGDPLRAALFDVPAATALAAVGSSPQTPTFAPEAARYDLSDDSRTARLQDALGAMTWMALAGGAGSRTNDTAPRSVVLTPPQQWTADAHEARAVLSTTATMLRSGLATARGLPDLVAGAESPPPRTLDPPERAAEDGAPATTVDGASARSPQVNALTETLVYDPQSTLTPTRFTTPLAQDLVRALSTSGHRGTERDAAAADIDAEQRVTEVGEALARVDDSVTVLAPGGAYTLASEQSPLLFVARNALPIGITVRLHLSAPSAMTITDIGDQQLPARGSRALQVPAKVTDTGKMVVDVALTTVNGHPLGEPVSVSVRSNSYGTVLAIITAGAGALLLLLAGRRLWHRFRGQPDRADEGYERR